MRNICFFFGMMVIFFFVMYCFKFDLMLFFYDFEDVFFVIKGFYLLLCVLGIFGYGG